MSTDLLLKLDRLQASIDHLTELGKLQLAEWLTIEHAALVCDCSYDHIRRAIEQGDLLASNISKSDKKAAHRIARADLKAWADKSRGEANAPPRSALKGLVNRYLPGLGAA